VGKGNPWVKSNFFRGQPLGPKEGGNFLLIPFPFQARIYFFPHLHLGLFLPWGRNYLWALFNPHSFGKVWCPFLGFGGLILKRFLTPFLLERLP